MFKKIKDFFNIYKETEFPCRNCLVRASCNFSKPCDKLEMDDKKVKNLIIKYKRCPDCGGEKINDLDELNVGPYSGISVDIQCSTCGHWFNISPVYIKRINIPPSSALEGVEQSP